MNSDRPSIPSSFLRSYGYLIIKKRAIARKKADFFYQTSYYSAMHFQGCPFKKLILGLLLLASSSLLRAEDSLGNGPFIVEKERYVINGRTRHEVLSNFLGDAQGMIFETEEDLASFVTARERKLENRRIFKESSVKVIVSSEERAPEGATPIILETRITDGKAFVPIPFAFYNSNEGVMAGVLGNAPNVRGSMQDVLFTGLYSAPPDQNDDLQWTDPNFILLLNWSGILLYPPFSLGFFTSIMKMNRKIEDRGEVLAKYNALSLIGTINLSIPIGQSAENTFSFGGRHILTNKVEFAETDESLAYGPYDWTITVKDTFSIKRFNWRGHFREGWKGQLEAEWEFIDPTYSACRTDVTLSGEASIFRIIGTRFNPQARIAAFTNTDLPHLDVASKVRGLRNGELKANTAITANTNVQILLARIGGTEIHLSPGFDIALAWTPEEDEREYDWACAAGGELLLFFDSIKSLPVKFGYAYDLRPPERNGSGKRYEIEFTFSLSY